MNVLKAPPFENPWDPQAAQKKAMAPGGQTTVGAIAPAAAAAAAPTSSLVLQKAYTPDYQNLILGDPSYLSWKNSANLDLAQAADQRKAALQALVIQRGGDEGLKDQYGDIGQDTLGLAKQNQFSDLAKLQRNYDDSVKTLKANLASRGMLQSGDLPYGMDQTNLNRASSENDIAQQFGQAANTIEGNYLDRQQQERQAQLQALQGAEQSVYSNPLYRPIAGSNASLLSNWQDYGQPVYQDENGALWTVGADGRPVPYQANGFVPQAPPPAAPAPQGGAFVPPPVHAAAAAAATSPSAYFGGPQPTPRAAVTSPSAYLQGGSTGFRVPRPLPPRRAPHFGRL